MLVLGEQYVAGESKHFEQFNCLMIHFREGDPRAVLFGDVDDAEQDRDADAVDELRVAEIYDQSAATAIELPAAFALDLFTGQLVEIVARVNNSGGANTMGAY